MELGKIWGGTCAALAIAMVARRSAAEGSGRLIVFLHVAVKQRALQSILQDALGGVVVTTVGRIGDLDRALREGQDAVLSLPVVLAANGLAPRLQGLRAGAADEPYALVGVNSPPNPSAVKAVGALDVLGRDGTTSLIHSLLGTQPKVERVTKVEDLLPLLQMDLVQAIVMASRFLPDLRATSQLNLVGTELPTRLGLPAVASVGPTGESVIAAIRRMPPTASTFLGVDTWR
jgi:hypothetical protein